MRLILLRDRETLADMLVREFKNVQVECRWRVIEVGAVYGDGEAISAQRIWEYKTPEAAAGREDALRAEGKTFVMQLGLVRWLTAEEEAAYKASLNLETSAIEEKSPGAK